MVQDRTLVQVHAKARCAADHARLGNRDANPTEDEPKSTHGPVMGQGCF